MARGLWNQGRITLRTLEEITYAWRQAHRHIPYKSSVRHQDNAEVLNGMFEGLTVGTVDLEMDSVVSVSEWKYRIVVYKNENAVELWDNAVGFPSDALLTQLTLIGGVRREQRDTEEL